MCLFNVIFGHNKYIDNIVKDANNFANDSL